MNTKARITKLEGVKPGQVDADNKQFTQEVRTESHKYFIDGVQVGEADYKKELVEYLRLRSNKNIPAEIVYNLAGGVQ